MNKRSRVPKRFRGPANRKLTYQQWLDSRTKKETKP